jgi:hypothetical protein
VDKLEASSEPYVTMQILLNIVATAAHTRF